MTSGNASATVSYTVKVYNDHAHPTNFRQTNGGRNPNDSSILHFEYAWDSTSGLLSDLSNCTVSEIVTYSGQGSYLDATLPNPPFNTTDNSWHTPNPTTPPDIPGTQGSAQDNHGHGNFVAPYSAYSFTGTQYYRFHCTTCMAAGEYDTLMGPISLVRSVVNELGDWKYTVTKSGWNGWLFLP